MLYYFIIAISRLLFKYFCHWQVTGRENLPPEGPVVVVCNHVSYWDPVVVGCALSREISYMAKEELFRIPLLGPILYRLRAFPIKRGSGDRGAMRAALGVLNQGELLGIFPEGTRSLSGELLPFKPGFAILATRSGAAILPMALIGVQRIWSRGWFHSFKVVIGEPIRVEQAQRVQSEAIHALADRVRQKVSELLVQ